MENSPEILMDKDGFLDVSDRDGEWEKRYFLLIDKKLRMYEEVGC